MLATALVCLLLVQATSGMLAKQHICLCLWAYVADGGTGRQGACCKGLCLNFFNLLAVAQTNSLQGLLAVAALDVQRALCLQALSDLRATGGRPLPAPRSSCPTAAASLISKAHQRSLRLRQARAVDPPAECSPGGSAGGGVFLTPSRTGLGPLFLITMCGRGGLAVMPRQLQRTGRAERRQTL